MTTFNKTFAAARRAGRKTFGWQGKTYTTELAKSSAPTPRSRPSAPTPRARPSSSGGSKGRVFGPGSRSLAVQERAKKGPSTAPQSHRPRSASGKRRKSESRLRMG
jgi:hypothetical protein